MELKYVKLLKDNNISESSLSGKVLIGIREIKNVQRGITLAGNKGQKVRQDVLDKLEYLDESVSGIIQSGIDSKDKEATEAARATAEAEKQAQLTELTNKLAEYERKEAEFKKNNPDPAKKDDNTEEVKPGDPKADKIDEDCAKALKDGKTKVSLADLKSISKTAYDIIFENYEAGGTNGVETTNYSVIETEKETFTITKL